MDWTLEVVVVPVTDVDRAKTFYTEKLGFNADVDTNVGDSFRVVQLTPPGSSCSITIGPLVVDEVPENSARLQLCVLDIEQARASLLAYLADLSDADATRPVQMSTYAAPLWRVAWSASSHEREHRRVAGDHLVEVGDHLLAGRRLGADRDHGEVGIEERDRPVLQLAARHALRL